MMATATLTPTEALGVALSTGPMHDRTMGECQAEAEPMIRHLAAMGFTLSRGNPREGMNDGSRRGGTPADTTTA